MNSENIAVNSQARDLTNTSLKIGIKEVADEARITKPRDSDAPPSRKPTDPIGARMAMMLFFIGLLSRSFLRSLVAVPALFFWVFALGMLSSKIQDDEIVPGFHILITCTPECLFIFTILFLGADLISVAKTYKKKEEGESA